MGIKDLFKKVVIDKPFEEAKREGVKPDANKDKLVIDASKPFFEYTKEEWNQFINSLPPAEQKYWIQNGDRMKEMERERYAVKDAKMPEGCYKIPRVKRMDDGSIYDREDPKASNYEFANTTRFGMDSLYPLEISGYENENVNFVKYVNQDNINHNNPHSRTPESCRQLGSIYWVDYLGEGIKEPDVFRKVDTLLLREEKDFSRYADAFLNQVQLFKYFYKDRYGNLKEGLGRCKIPGTEGKGKFNYSKCGNGLGMVQGTTNVQNLHEFAKMYENGQLTYSEYIAWTYAGGVIAVHPWYTKEELHKNIPDEAYQFIWNRMKLFDTKDEEIPMGNSKEIADYAARKIKNSVCRSLFFDMCKRTFPLSYDKFKEIVDKLEPPKHPDERAFKENHAALFARNLPCTLLTMGDPNAPRARERVEFVTSWSETYQRIAALLVAYLPIDHDNLLESMTCNGGILDCLDAMVEKYGMSKADRFKIQQLVLSVSDIEDPLHDQFRRYYICGAKNLRELCEFRNRFYEMGLGIQRSIGSRADRHVPINPTETDYRLADYTYAIKSAIHGDKAVANNGSGQSIDKSVYDDSMEQAGYVQIWRPACAKNYSVDIPNDTAKWISISAKDADDFNQKLYTLLPDLLHLNADVFVASKQNAIENGESFKTGTRVCGYHIMLKQSNWNVKAFLDKHPELLTDTGIAASNAMHLGGCIYGYYGMFGENTKSGQKFTLDDFIKTCETHPIEKTRERFDETFAELQKKSNEYKKETREERDLDRDKMIWNFYAVNRYEFEKYRDGGMMIQSKHEALGMLDDITMAQEIAYARNHDPFGFNEQILDAENYEIDIE